MLAKVTRETKLSQFGAIAAQNGKRIVCRPFQGLSKARFSSQLEKVTIVEPVTVPGEFDQPFDWDDWKNREPQPVHSGTYEEYVQEETLSGQSELAYRHLYR